MKKRLVLTTGVLIIGSIIGVAALQNPESTTAVDSPIAQEVDRQGQVLNNHEGRITNTENDVKDLQSNTGTPPSVTRVEVPAQPPSAPAPIQPPITIVGYEVIPIPGSENKDCKYTYSDGSTRQFLWQIVTYNQGTKFTQTNDFCDYRIIGKVVG